MRRLGGAIAIAVLAGACGLLGPDLECRDIDRAPCERAAEIATDNLDDRVGPSSWFEDTGPARILVEVGCGQMGIACPPVAHATTVTVTFFAGDAGEEPIYARVWRSELGIPDESPCAV